MDRINGEPVVKVESFDELKTGVLVWLTDCRKCSGGKHRAIILRREAGALGQTPSRGICRVDYAWYVAPTAPCGVNGFPDYAVTDGFVFRVVDTDSKSQSRTKSKELAK